MAQRPKRKPKSGDDHHPHLTHKFFFAVRGVPGRGLKSTEHCDLVNIVVLVVRTGQ